MNKYRPPITDEVRAALKAANKGPGWNVRNVDVQRFAIGHAGRCELIVVPYRLFRYRQDGLLQGKRVAG